MDPARMNRMLRPLLLLIWAICWFFYWVTGSRLLTGIVLLTIGTIASLALIGLSMYLWSRHSYELLE